MPTTLICDKALTQTHTQLFSLSLSVSPILSLSLFPTHSHRDPPAQQQSCENGMLGCSIMAKMIIKIIFNWKLDLDYLTRSLINVDNTILLKINSGF